MLSVETRRSFPFRFGFAGLVRVERIAGTGGGLLESLLDEAAEADLLDDDTRTFIRESLPAGEGSPELQATLARLTERLELVATATGS